MGNPILTQEIIESYLEERYKDSFTFESFIYTGTRQKVKATCIDCGNIYHSALSNFRKPNPLICKCNKNREQLINFFISIHGDSCSYDKLEYNPITDSSYTKIIVYCNNCKEYYETTIINHEKYKGCIKCRKEFISTEAFIKKAIEIHGDKYDYSLVDYNPFTHGKKSHKIKIICKKHNTFFETTVDNHIKRKQGCPICARRCIDTKLVITECLQSHGINKFGYNKAIYMDCKTPMKIYCKTCNTYFYTTFRIHKNYKLGGCRTCRRQATIARETLTQEEVIRKAKSIHGDKYSYHAVNYVHGKIPVKIWCNTCKKYFWQSMRSHTSKNKAGCPNCKSTKGERLVQTFLDRHNIKYVTQKKYRDCILWGDKNNRKLRYDFYLPENNILIEYDGGQHFKYVPYWHKTKDNFIECIKRDLQKDFYAFNNDITLIRIPYWEKDNIETILKEKLLKK